MVMEGVGLASCCKGGCSGLVDTAQHKLLTISLDLIPEFT
jgi:hypothetical protein